MKRKLSISLMVMLYLYCLTNYNLAAQQNNPTNIAPKISHNELVKQAQKISNLKFGMFICWSFSTFSNVEWTRGVKDVSWFNPTGCDTDQWCRIAKQAGMHYILFLTKHHDGFCLWDTKTTNWKVTKSPLGIDVLAKLKKSCDKYGLKLALYFSEGDWTWPGKKNPEQKKAQLKELLTNYGPILYIWFDHAQGDGGLNHKQTVAWVKKFQPLCFAGFNTGQPAGDIRLGEMGKPTEVTDISGAGQGAKYAKGYKGYLLAEFTYPILGGRKQGRWFYTMPEWDNKCVSAEQIYRDYLKAVKFHNIFSLDVAPNRAGKLRDIDIKTLLKVGKYIRGELKLPPQSQKN